MTGELGVHSFTSTEHKKTIMVLGRFSGLVVTVTHDPHVHYFTVLGERSPQVLGRGEARQVTDEHLTVFRQRLSTNDVAGLCSAGRWTRPRQTYWAP